ncbi:MAG: tRNA (N(6)-L-threonylcarbamoyladenosine(37)-C(2))-methylthiotransferase MtaB [Pirellulaceae bacterium]|nr:tRNA (N(6)-L-threonylcarbamoyladenosine(37)-C(2))-methylthiotransferase MtaB [Planctomycetales bacterium]
MTNSPLLRTHTLGCKVNQYETELVRESLLQHGYADAQMQQPADLCIVNTCTVTAEGDAKSRQVVRRMARKNPDARIVVMGCYATRAPEELRTLPGVAEVVTDKRELPDVLGRFGVIDLPTGISQFGSRHRAYVKVQDGCLLRCSYCIIPQVRPHMASRPLEDIVDEARRLSANGYHEIVLTGIHLGHYGVDWNWNRPKSQWTRLSTLVARLAELPDPFRIRLSSIEATEVTRELLDVMANYPHKVCPHLHICLQSGSDRVLQRMNRRWGAKRFVDRCQMVRERLDDPAITTDIIVGFPGESDADFAATCDVAREVGFSKIHIFPFSARRGTPAAEFTDRLPAAEIAERGARLTELEQQLRTDYFQRLTGRRLRVLVESAMREDAGQYTGTSCRYAPVQFPVDPNAQPGQIIDLHINDHAHDRVFGTMSHGCPQP